MGEKETATEEAERLKNKTKSNQSNDRLDQGDEDADAGAAALVKTKTKSNQSNDRTDQSGADDDGDAGRASGPRQANQGFRAGPDDDGDGGPVDAAINNTKSNIKNREGMFGGGETGARGSAVSDEGMPADKPRPKSS